MATSTPDKDQNTELQTIQESIELAEKSPVFDLFKTPAKFQAKSAKRTPKRKQTDEDHSRPRTPSGQVLTSSIGDIKNLFEQQCQDRQCVIPPLKRRQASTATPLTQFSPSSNLLTCETPDGLNTCEVKQSAIKESSGQSSSKQQTQEMEPQIVAMLTKLKEEIKK